MHYELFNHKGIHTHNGPSVDAAKILERDTDPASFLASSFSVTERAKCFGGGVPKAVGFKVFPEHILRSQLSMDMFDQVLADERVAKIMLKRENRVKTCASVVRSSVTGRYNKENLDHVKVHILPHELQKFIDSYDGYYAYVKERLGRQSDRWLEISYEDFVENTPKEMKKICDLLKVSRFCSEEGKVEKYIPKQTAKTLRETFENYDELSGAFLGKERERDFEA